MQCQRKHLTPENKSIALNIKLEAEKQINNVFRMEYGIIWGRNMDTQKGGERKIEDFCVQKDGDCKVTE